MAPPLSPPCVLASRRRRLASRHVESRKGPLMEPRTFRGLSLAEVERKVRAELGDDAVVVRQREGLSGGVGGFFQRKLYEVDALPGAAAPAVEPQDAAPAP